MSRITLRNQQSGLVSIIVAMGFLAILTLMATSFAFLSRREVRQAIDRQLSTQAFYAAESGVNDAVHKITSPGGLANLNACNQASLAGPPNLTTDGTLKYTCVLVDQQPTSLDFSSVGTESSIILKVQSANGAAINTLKFGWQSPDNSDIFTDFSGHELPDKNSDQKGLDHTGIVRATIIPGKLPVSRDYVINNSTTAFLYPKSSSIVNQSGSTTFVPGRGSNSQGDFINGQCNTGSTPNFCNAQVTGLGSMGSSVFYIRLKSVYAATKVRITALDGTNNTLAFANSQAMIDATGKANDVIRRIQVRVPLTSSYYYPEFALETGDDICKRMNIVVGQPVNNLCPFN